jgi:hypothetical protein
VNEERVRDLVRQLSAEVGLDTKPAEPVTIVGTRYEASEDPARPGTWEVTLLSDHSERRQFLPRAARGDYIPTSEEEAS